MGISHLFFADDILIFGEANYDTLSSMIEVLNSL